MSIESLAFDLARSLTAAGIDYMLVGSFASNQYGIPRSTKDADFVLDLPADQIEKLYQTLAPTWEVDEQITFESITGSRRLEVRKPETEFLIELFFLGDDAHHLLRWERKVLEYVGGERFWFPTAEDVIIQKLRWGRPKDLGDVESVISVQASRLDFGYIRHWCDQHKTLDRLTAIRKNLPPDLGGTT